MLARLWNIVWGSSANRSLVCLVLIVGLLHWAGKWEWWGWLFVVAYAWWSLQDAVLQEWAPKAINRMARPAVWTLRFSLSRRYLEGFLAERGVGFRFDEEPGRGSRTFPDRLIIESFSDRLRIHRWLVPAGGGAASPKYDWFDTPRPGEALLWSLPLSDAAGTKPSSAVKLSVLFAGDKTSNRLFRKLTLWLDRGTPRMPVGPFPTIPSVDIVFEVPLDAQLLGDSPGDPARQRRTICRIDARADGHTWACYAGREELFDWGWSLHLRET